MVTHALYVIAALGCLLVSLFVVARWYEGKAMFEPSRKHLLTPQGVGLPPPMEIFIDSGGAKIHAWFFARDLSAPTLLYIHGNAGNAADRLPVIKGYLDLGLNVFIYDPRGYGKSEGKATPGNFMADAFTAYRHLTEKRGIDPSAIVVLGQSLGGMAALRLANSVKCKGLALEGTFVSVRQLVKDLHPKIPVWLLVTSCQDNEREIRKLKVPVLLIFGTMDGTIPTYHSKRLFKAAHQPCELLEVKGAGHTDMYMVAPKLYYGAIARFAK